MYTVKTSAHGFRLMEIVDADIDVVTDYVWEASSSIKKYVQNKEDFALEDLEVCRLDPGGMLNTNEPWEQFKIGKYSFEIQLSKIDWVISKIRGAKECAPNCLRINMWMWSIFITKESHEKLLDVLTAMSHKDNAIHRRIDDFELKSKLEKNGYIVFTDIPREE